jgi:SSS family solute:Na+ symporter
VPVPTSTIVTLDLVGRWRGLAWPEERLVRVGRWSGAIGLLIGALLTPLVMRWESIFRYAQDLWAPMAAPIVVVFLCGALWPSARERGALACLWLAVLTVPLTLARAMLADAGIHFLPPNLENPLVFAGAVSLVCWAMMGSLRDRWSPAVGWGLALAAYVPVFGIAAWSPVLTAVLVAASMLAFVGVPLARRSPPRTGMWDRTLLGSGAKVRWWASVGFWWLVLAAAFAGIYGWFW